MKRNRLQLSLYGRLLARVLVAGLLLAAGGCTEQQVLEVDTDGTEPLTLHFTRPDLGPSVTLTRGGGSPGATENLPAGATVRIAAYYRKATDGQVAFETAPPTYQATYVVKPDGSLDPCAVDDDGKKMDGASASGLSVRGGKYDFYAVSPARKLQAPSAPPPADNNYRIAGIQHKEDVMTSFQRDVEVSASQTAVTLSTFKRKCAQVVFNVEPQAGTAVPFASLKGKELVLKRISTAGASLVAGINAAIAATKDDNADNPASQMKLLESDFVDVASAPGTPALNKATGAILPMSAGPFDVEIKVERDGEQADLKATIDQPALAFDPAKRYIFTLRVRNNKASLILRVIEWNMYQVSDPGVGTPGGGSFDPDIVPGVGIPMQVAEWNNILWKGNGSAGNSPFLTIDQPLADKYKALGTITVSDHPPFNYDMGLVTGLGNDYMGNSLSCTLPAPYMIEVESTQDTTLYTYDSGDAINHCKNKGDGWRVPTIIELFAMWDKCKGSNYDATDNEDASTALGDKFIGGGDRHPGQRPVAYWSSSITSDLIDQDCRCSILLFSGSSINYDITSEALAVRCVRDVSDLNVTDPAGRIIAGGGTVTTLLAVRPGLQWSISPATDNGITVSPAQSAGSNGGFVKLTFTASANPGEEERTATFTVTATGPGVQPRTARIKVEQDAPVTINQDVLRKYAVAIGSTNLTDYPPFDMDNDHGTAVKTKHGIDFTLAGVSSTMTGSYKLQVQSTQPPDRYRYQFGSTYPARDYCSTLNVDGHTDWRLPTIIEAYVMWDKAKGTNTDVTDSEPDSRIFGDPFIGSVYWSSSVYGGYADRHCVLYFNNGGFGWSTTDGTKYVRCVRDL